MSLYREVGRQRRRQRLVAVAVVGVLALAAIAIVLATGDSGSSAEDRADDARRALQEAENGFELLQIEYGQAVRAGEVVAPTEYDAARADLARVRKALADNRAALTTADPRALGALTEQLDALDRSVRERAPADRVGGQIAEARRRLDALRAAVGSG
ncbi:MAG TPA: hypothetical protein VF549_06415 [Solirubrobacteraceae bacterium]|jgi:hypothetical protein